MLVITPCRHRLFQIEVNCVKAHYSHGPECNIPFPSTGIINKPNKRHNLDGILIPAHPKSVGTLIINPASLNSKYSVLWAEHEAGILRVSYRFGRCLIYKDSPVL